jgi:hypothetical protein
VLWFQRTYSNEEKRNERKERRKKVRMMHIKKLRRNDTNLGAVWRIIRNRRYGLNSSGSRLEICGELYCP